MKNCLVCTCFLILFSCKNAPVDLGSLSTASKAALIQVANGEQVSQNQNPTFLMAFYYEDALVPRVAIYDSNSCDPNFKLGEISNQIGSSVTSSLQLTEGSHNFYYKPVYDNLNLNLTALCSPTGLNYTVDRTAPSALALTLVTPSLTSDRNVGITVSGCENTQTGSSSLIFKEQTSLPLASDIDWQSCTANKIFTISSNLASKYIFAFAKDQAGNISQISNYVTVILTTPPNITASVNPVVTYLNNLIASISFSNSGGIIQTCTSSPALPAGLSVSLTASSIPNLSTCVISGTPIAVATSNTYRIAATGAGSSSADISIEVKPLPMAIINFNLAAGPGISGTNFSGGEPYVTYLNAGVGGSDVTNFIYAVSTSATDCSAVTYSTVVSTSQPITMDLSGSEGTRTVCIKGINSVGITQQVPTIVSWTQKQLFEDFISLSNPNIVMYDQPINTDMVSRYFKVDGTASNVNLSCDSNCTIQKYPESTWSNSQSISRNDIVRFKNSAATFSDQTITGTITLTSTTLSKTYKLIGTSVGSICNTAKKVFLTKKVFNLNSGGVTSADAFCSSEATYNSLTAVNGWKAMLSTNLGGTLKEGLELLRTYSSTLYCDARTNRPIIGTISPATSFSFTKPFTNFVDNLQTNGAGNGTEWKYVKDAPRYLSATQFWYGDTTCNCDNWTNANPLAGACSGASVGQLNFESSTNNPLANLPVIGSTLATSSSCSVPQHLVCFEQ